MTLKTILTGSMACLVLGAGALAQETPEMTALADTDTQQAQTLMIEDKTPMAQTEDTMQENIHAVWTDLLSAYTMDKDGVVLVDYAGLKDSAADAAQLNSYIDTLAAMTPSEFSRDEALAYWANLYNALTVKLIIDNYPVDSIREIKPHLFSIGPWKMDAVVVEGETMSLDNIEHDTMREKYPDPRIHYMVNCASYGCPNLMQRAWTVETLEEDMNAAARAYVNHPRGASVENGRLKVSTIYKWYKGDFGGDDAGIIAHLKTYADGDLKADLDGITRISKDDYDWSLNKL